MIRGIGTFEKQSPGTDVKKPAFGEKAGFLLVGKTAPESAAELRAKHGIDLSGICLSLRRLHALTDKRVEGLLLAGAEFFNRLRIVGEHFVDDLL